MKNVAINGFGGSGSSAVIDLLREFETTNIVFGDLYEHYVFLYPNSIFDLECKLFKNPDPSRSDEAILSFIDTQKYLYENEFTWFASYKKLCGPKYMDYVYEYVNEISIQQEQKWYYRYKKTKFSFIKFVLQKILNILHIKEFKRFGYINVYDKRPGYLSYCTYEEFQKATKKFISNMFTLMGEEGKLNIYDHLLWPQQNHYVGELFEDTKVITVNRDPRDLFIINKYYWSQTNDDLYYPKEAEQFCKYWKNLYSNATKNDNILNVNFEELVYHTEETTHKICQFLGICDEQHIYKKKFFNPERSIKNTQTFKLKSEWQKEVEIIEKELSEYCFEFPIESQTSFDEMFV